MEIKYSQSRRKSAAIAGLLLGGNGLFFALEGILVQAAVRDLPAPPPNLPLEIPVPSKLPPEAMFDRYSSIGSNTAPWEKRQALYESFVNGKSFNPNQKTQEGFRIALICAVSTLPQNDLLQKLLANGDLIVSVKTALGNSPLHFAAAHSTENLALLLADGRLDINEANCSGKTPLFIAMECENSTNVNALLADPRIRVNATNERGWTALHIAVMHGDKDVVGQLMGLKASYGEDKHELNPNVKDDTGHTPADYLANIKDLDLRREIQNYLVYAEARYGDDSGVQLAPEPAK
ncbi:MAG: ankyrin repeat domain-containing protein [Puniceicoccales bacterium]|jgi:ankyrin repeat protein|nr:ankyrin repeat domain-containing protein [Puniceicoccales bacterium]